MQYTTHGAMTPADLADHAMLYDLNPEACGNCEGPLASDGACADDACGDDDEPFELPVGARGPMDMHARIRAYRKQGGGRITARQRRRMMKKAGRDPLWMVTRDDGMGFQPAMQGYREMLELPIPISGGPY